MAQSKRFSPMRFTAATEEAAISGALEMAGATREEADYEILDVSAKGVTVRVKPREEDAVASTTVAPTAPVNSVMEVPVAAAAPEESEPEAPFVLDAPAESPVAEAEVEYEEDEEDDADFETDSEIEAQLDVDDEDAPTLAEEDEAVEEDADSDESYEDEEEDDADADAEADSDVDAEESEADSAPALEAEPEPVSVANEETVASAQATAQAFLDKMGLEATCIYESGATGTNIPLIIEGNDVGILIGKHGATLQAFQYLLNLTVNNGIDLESGVRVVVDAGNYRARRQNSLEQTARAAAQRARMSGRPVRLDAMPASERRIIHMFLQSEPGITTQSEGREPQRRLVIFPGQGGASGAGGTGAARYEDRGGSDRRGGMGGFNRGRGGRGFRR